MSEQLATAEPVVETTGGQTAPDTSSPSTSSAPTTEAAPAREKEYTLDEILSRTYDKMQAPKVAEKEAPEAPETPDQPSIQKPEPAQSSSAIEAPPSWSAEQAAKFATLPPEVQKYVHQRETEATQLISRQGAELKSYQPIREVYGALNSWGVPQGREAEVVQSWAKAQAILDNNPGEGIKWLAQSYGLDLAQLAGQPKSVDTPSGVDDLFKDPRVDALEQRYQRKIAELESQQQRITGHLTAREQAEESQRIGYANKAIQKFSTDKPYFAQLKEDLEHEVPFIRQREPGLPLEQVLEKAYDRALYANPQIRERVLADQRKAETDKAQKDLVAKQAQAKKAQAMNVRTGASASTPTYDGKWDDRDKLSALFDKING